MSKLFNFIAPQKSPFFYGWVVLVVGALGLLMSAPGQTIGVSAFTDHLLEALEMSRDQLSFAYMVGTMLSAVMLTRAGIFFDRYGAVKTALLASIGLGVALLYLSQIDKISNVFGGSVVATISTILLGFVFIRFFGQGVITLASRTMVVKWFDARRGLAIGILSAITAFGHSLAPLVFNDLIENNGWSNAWVLIGIFSALIFPIIIVLFFKKEPEYYGLQPDGNLSTSRGREKLIRFPVYKDYNLNEARTTLSLWVYAGLTALYGLVITGVTFHIVSIFAERALSKELAINVFQPLAFVAVTMTIICSYLSDFIKLKYLAIVLTITGILGMIGIINLGASEMYYYVLIVAFGMSSGIHPLIITLFLPRFYGKKYLGAITGQAMTLVVFASSLGPILFSQSLTLTGNYNLAAYICGAIYLLLLIGVYFTRNPQLQHQ